MRVCYRALAAAGGIAILSACTSGQSAIEPPFTAVNPQNFSLQFRVGTVNLQGTNTFFNTVVTYRQPNGLSGTLYNTPTITGPTGFTVPVGTTMANSPSCAGVSPPMSGIPSSNPPQPGTDAGTNRISATPPTQPGTPATPTTFGQQGGIFAYGFAPANSTSAGTANYAGRPGGSPFPSTFGSFSNVYTQPIYCPSAARLPFIIGPPAVPDFHNPNAGFPVGFYGYDSGFMSFAVAPVSGTYALHMTVPSNTIGQNSAVFDQTATLDAAVVLGTESPPVISQPAPGGPISFTVGPAPAGATFQVIYVIDTAKVFYTINAGAAGGTFQLAAGMIPGGRSIRAVVVGADWDIIGGAVPNNTSPTPTLPAQTDITISPTSPAFVTT